jgi:hypothetical protein
MAVSRKRKFNLDDIVSAYERKQLGIANKITAQILQLFDDNTTRIAFLYAKRKLVNNRFLPRDIRATIETLTSTINAKTKNLIIVGVRQSFENSRDKNNLIETKTAGRRVPPGKRSGVAVASSAPSDQRLTTAVNEFIKRKNKGLNLSDRVWKLSNSWKKTVNDTMIKGLEQGTAARELAHKLQKAVRTGSANAAPGPGVYKSPYKNALRLTRNEVNIAYNSADYERWQMMPTVVGIEVKLSNRHPVYDMCDNLKGTYPKTFKFTRWHVNCLCAAIPKLATQEERDAIMDYKLGLIDTPPDLKYVKDIPGTAKIWIRDNADRVEGWKNTPYWWNNNKAVVNQVRERNK